jgi:uncharacterized protein
MKIEGQFVFEGGSPLAVWSFLTDATRIAQCLPGCEKLVQTGEGTFDLLMRFGVGSISGVFSGSIRLHDLQPSSEYRMSVSGRGAPGFVNGEGTIQLTPDDTGTLLHYSGDVSAGGPIASLGQRMIGGAARMAIDQFFKCVVGKLTSA